MLFPALALAAFIVDQGGTGVNIFPAGLVYSPGGKAALTSTTSPTVGYLTATSTTASSTFANGITLSGGCFKTAGGVCLVSASGFAASSTLLTDNNTFSGTNIFSVAGTTTFSNGISFKALSLNGTVIGSIAPPLTTTNGQLGCTTCNTSNATVSSVGLSSTNLTLSIGATPVTTSGTITADLNLGHSNWWTAAQNFTNASTSELTATSSVWLTGVTASRPLYVNSAGLVGSAGSGTSGNCVQWGANNTLGDAGSACGTGGGSASSTLLTDNNTFSGTNLFTNSASNFGGTWQTFSPSHFNVNIGATSTNPMMATYYVATSTLTASRFPLASSTAITASGTIFANNFYDTSAAGSSCIGDTGGILENGNCVASLASAGGSLTISSPTGNVDASINLGHSNSWSSLQLFNAAASTTLFSAYGPSYFGGTSTTTISLTGAITGASGVTHTLPNASTTNLTAGTSLGIPNSATPSLSSNGYMAVNTSAASTSVDFYGNSAQQHLYAVNDMSFTFINYPVNGQGTTTFWKAGGVRGFTVTGGSCFSQGGTANVDLGTGSATTTDLLSTTGTQALTTFSSNNTFNYLQPMLVAIGNFSAAGTTTVTCTYGRNNTY